MKTTILTTLLMLTAGSVAVLAATDTDRKIEDTAKASYNFRTVLDNQVKARAHEGVVTLSGTVPDKDDKALAADTVGNIPGVTSINNEIVVTPLYPEHSDAWMAFKIRSRLLTKAHVSAATTTVAVKDGVATLGGTATTLAQKELTAIYAKEIDWVKSVKNEIAVQAPTSAPGETIGEQIDDASITTQVKYALLSHKSTSALKTKVSTLDGVTTLAGIADSPAEKALVTKLAEDVRGVKSVNNNMTVSKS